MKVMARKEADDDTSDGGKKVIIKTDDSGGEGSFQLPIQKRTFVSSPSASSDAPTDTGPVSNAPEPPHVAPSKRNVIAPLNSSLSNAANAKFMDTKPVTKRATPVTPQTKTGGEEKQNTSAGNEALASPAPKFADAQKGGELSEEDIAKREKEIQDIISSRQYFVPVDAVARRRSDKVSLGLTLLILLLSIALVDLLLDTGAILLLQKVPHTHFFSIYNNQK